MIHILGVIHVEIGHHLASAKRIKTEDKGEPLGPERILGQTVRTDTLVPSLKTVAIFRIREREWIHISKRKNNEENAAFTISDKDI